MRTAILALATLPGVAWSAQFTETEAELNAFGLSTWPWVTELENGKGVDRYIWLAQDGGRIRFLDPFTGQWEASPHIPDPSNPAPRRHADTYRDLEVFQPFPPLDQWCGLVVGDDGQWGWAMGDLTDPAQANIVWNDLAPVSFTNPFGDPVSEPDLFGVHVIPEATGTGSPPRMWFVGDEHVLGYTTSIADPTSAVVLPTVTPYPNEAGSPTGAGERLPLRGITFAPDGLHGIACGDSVAYYTEDGGVTWEPSKFSFVPQYEPGGGPTPSTTPDYLGYSGGAGELVTEFWAAVLDRETNPGSGKWEGFMVGGQLVQNGQFMFRTTDGGKTWIQERTSCAAFGNPCTVTDPCTNQSNFEPCTGTQWDLGNGGGPQSQTTQYTVHRMPNGDVLCGGYLGQTFRRPAGSTGYYIWDDVSSFCDPEIDATTLWGIHGAPGSDFVFACGAWGEAKSSSDSGLTWVSETPYRRWRFNDLDGVFDTSGNLSALYTTGQNLRIARSVDGGSSWSQQRGIEGWTAPFFGEAFEAISVFGNGTDSLDDDIGVCVGGRKPAGGGVMEPIILYTLDGGLTCWQEADLTALPPAPGNGKRAIMAVAYNQDATNASNVRFVAVTDRGEVIESIDLGQSWQYVDQPSNRPLTSVSLATANVGLFGGGDATTGELLISFNLAMGSPTFADASPTGVTPSLVNEVFTNRFVAYAVGDNGELWKYGGGGQFSLVTGLPAYAQGSDLISIHSGPGQSPTIAIGGAAGLLMEYDGANFERHHAGVSNDLDTMVVDGTNGVHFMSINDRVKTALGTSEVLFGPIAQPSFMYSEF